MIFYQILSTYPFKEMYGDHFEEFVRVKRVDPLFDENAECFAAFKAS